MSIFPENVSTYGQEIDSLFWLIFAFVALAFVVSLFVLLYPLFRSRYSPARKAAYFTGENRKHFRWVTMALVGLALSDFVILFAEHGTWVKIESPAPSADFKVCITGRQWNWIFTYPGLDGQLYTPDDVVVDVQDAELHIPVNANVEVDLKARDVLHSLFIVNARFKQDVIPGRTLTRWFNIQKEGRYDITCAEICGVLHSRMRNFLVVESKESFEKYLSDLYASAQTKP